MGMTIMIDGMMMRNSADCACRDYIPSDTGLNRLAWTVQFFANNGFYVLLDNQ